jgi:hypothetical protein
LLDFFGGNLLLDEGCHSVGYQDLFGLLEEGRGGGQFHCLFRVDLCIVVRLGIGVEEEATQKIHLGLYL